MKTKFIKGALYFDPLAQAVLEFSHRDPDTDGPRFTVEAGTPNYVMEGNLVGFLSGGRSNGFPRAYHYTDLLTPADGKKAEAMIDPMNGVFEEDVHRHLAARRAKLRNLTAILGGEYYAR